MTRDGMGLSGRGGARIVLAAAAVVIAASACSPSGGERDAPEVVLIGIDGFDWNLVDPLVEAGRMPVMERLLAEGTRADLLTLVPLEKSPVIWTTIATGRLPGEQGRGFLVPTEDDRTGETRQVYTAWHRTHRAFWNILSEQGRTVSVLGWLETWPAEPVNGSIVTDYVKYFVEQGGDPSGADRRTWPDSLYAEFDSLVVFPSDLPDPELAPFLGEELPPDPPKVLRDKLNVLRWVWAGDLTFTAIARSFLRERPEETMAIYLRGPDAICHDFWGDRMEAAESGEPGLFGDTIDAYFQEADRQVGEILKEIDLTRTTVFLVSDHGFQGPRTALDGSSRFGIYMHRELGTVLTAGPWAAGKGLRVEGARVQDVLPTLLHGLGLPVAEDLDGVVAKQLLSPAGGRDRPVETIATYEIGDRARDPEAPESPVADEIREQVEALGYVE
ncbi:MAG TPA: alkaline phosphatase family protein [bacterium]|nr:alkaline phosphatase family protein [bacterium]